MKIRTLATAAGASLKKPVNVVDDPSPVAETLEIVGVSASVPNET